MTKHIQITDMEYEKFAKLKEKYRAKSFSHLVRMLTRDMDLRDMLASEISMTFDELKIHLSQSMLDGRVGSMLERMRVMIVRVAKVDPEKRNDVYQVAEAALDKAMSKTLAACNAAEKKKIGTSKS